MAEVVMLGLPSATSPLPGGWGLCPLSASGLEWQVVRESGTPSRPCPNSRPAPAPPRSAARAASAPARRTSEESRFLLRLDVSASSCVKRAPRSVELARSPSTQRAQRPHHRLHVRRARVSAARDRAMRPGVQSPARPRRRSRRPPAGRASRAPGEPRRRPTSSCSIVAECTKEKKTARRPRHRQRGASAPPRLRGARGESVTAVHPSLPRRGAWLRRPGSSRGPVGRSNEQALHAGKPSAAAVTGRSCAAMDAALRSGRRLEPDLRGPPRLIAAMCLRVRRNFQKLLKQLTSRGPGQRFGSREWRRCPPFCSTWSPDRSLDRPAAAHARRVRRGLRSGPPGVARAASRSARETGCSMLRQGRIPSACRSGRALTDWYEGPSWRGPVYCHPSTWSLRRLLEPGRRGHPPLRGRSLGKTARMHWDTSVFPSVRIPEGFLRRVGADWGSLSKKRVGNYMLRRLPQRPSITVRTSCSRSHPRISSLHGRSGPGQSVPGAPSPAFLKPERNRRRHRPRQRPATSTWQTSTSCGHRTTGNGT